MAAARLVRRRRVTPLSPDRWHRVQELFVDALQQPPSSRAAWLDAQCSGDPELRHEIDSLLSADSPSDADAVYARAIGDAVADAANATVAIADRIGPYCILREIGHGGMATVFLARRDDEFEHHVAI